MCLLFMSNELFATLSFVTKGPLTHNHVYLSKQPYLFEVELCRRSFLPRSRRTNERRDITDNPTHEVATITSFHRRNDKDDYDVLTTRKKISFC